MAMRRFVSVGPALVVLFSGALLLVAGPGIVRRLWAAKTAATIEESRRVLAADDFLSRLDQANRLVAQSVTPSVVHVEVTLEGRRGGSSGAGWVFDDDGHIVTNAHVVSNARFVRVQYEDGFSQPAEIVGMDVFTDIAVLKVEPGPSLFPLARATQHRVEIGDRIFAVGSPFGLKFSISEGIVSGLGRSARAALGFSGITNYIQTDAAVNPGNSGGPLVNSAGELIGMNVAIANALNQQGSLSEGQSAGISFAIPLATIEARVEQIITGGSPMPAIMGISFTDDDAKFVDAIGFRGTGVRVDSVIPGGAAEAAGMLGGDQIVEINGQSIQSVDTMRAMISTARPGSDIPVRVWRGNALMDLTVRVSEASEDVQVRLHLRLLTERIGLRPFGANGGVMIAGVVPDSPAADAGFEPGMLIVRIGPTEVASVQDLARAVWQSGLSQGKRVNALVRMTDGSERELPLRVFNLPTPGR